MQKKQQQKKLCPLISSVFNKLTKINRHKSSVSITLTSQFYLAGYLTKTITVWLILITEECVTHHWKGNKIVLINAQFDLLVIWI